MATKTTVSIEWPGGGVSNNDIAADAQIAATKTIHQQVVPVELYPEGTVIAAVASRLVHSCYGSTGSLVALEGSIFTQATGADRTVTIDLEKSTGAGAFASVLGTTINITDSTPIRTPQPAVINDTTISDGDIFRLVVTVAGAAGNQAEGLLVNFIFRENPT